MQGPAIPEQRLSPGSKAPKPPTTTLWRQLPAFTCPAKQQAPGSQLAHTHTLGLPLLGAWSWQPSLP